MSSYKCMDKKQCILFTCPCVCSFLYTRGTLCCVGNFLLFLVLLLLLLLLLVVVVVEVVVVVVEVVVVVVVVVVIVVVVVVRVQVITWICVQFGNTVHITVSLIVRGEESAILTVTSIIISKLEENIYDC